MSLLSFNWDKHFLYAIIYWILEIGVRLVMYLKWEDFFQISNSEVQNEYIYVIFLTIADLLSAFLVLYVKVSFKNNLNQRKKSETEVELIYDDYEGGKQKNVIKRLIIICVCTYFSRSLYWISYAITRASNEKVSHQFQKDVVNTIDIFMRYIFSIFILHIVIHRHRIVSMGGIIVGFLFLLPADIVLLYKNEKQKFLLSAAYVAILAIRGVSIPFEDTFIKLLYTENYVLPENFMLFRGIIVSIIIVILTPILFFSFGLTLDIHFNPARIITIIIYTLASSVKSYFLLKIIYYFSSQSVSFLVISESVSGSILHIINFIRDEEKDNIEIMLVIMEIIGIIIIAFATLLYDEIIIINKWGLNENVKKVIIDRGEDDLKKMRELEFTRESTIEENNINDNHDNDINENLQNKVTINEVDEDE